LLHSPVISSLLGPNILLNWLMPLFYIVSRYILGLLNLTMLCVSHFRSLRFDCADCRQ
jgi:hypothetical protein